MEFSSDRKHYSVADIYDKLHKSLPLVLKVKQGYSGDLLDKPLEKGQIIVLAVVSTQRRVVARLLSYIKPRILSLPTSFGETLCVMDDDTVTYGHEGYIYTIIREHQLPLEARLPKDHNISFDHQHFSTNDIPGFYFEKVFEEVNLLGNLIIDGKVDEDEILAVPLFLTELRFSVVSGIKGKKKQDWVAYQEKLREICASVPYDFEYGSTQIAEYSHDNILYREEYARIEPKCFVKLQELVELAPPVPTIKEFEYKRPPVEEATKSAEKVVDDDYEVVDNIPDIMPKPFIHKRPPPPIPNSELPPTEEAPPSLHNQPRANLHPLDTHQLPSPKTFRPPLPKPRENASAYHSSHVQYAQKIAEEILLKTNKLSNTNTPVLDKPKLQDSLLFQDEKSPLTRPLMNEDQYISMQADFKPLIDGSNALTECQLQLAPPNKKSAPPPKLAKLNVQRTHNTTSSANKMESIPNLNQSGNFRTSDIYVEINVFENNANDAEDGYDYLVPVTTKQTANKPNKQDVNDTTNANVFGLKLYENDLPRQTVNPVKTEPTSNSVFADEKAKQKSEKPEDAEEKLTIDVAELTVEDVCEYLAKLHLEKYSNSFLENMVDGEALLALDEEILMGDFEMKKIEALRLIRFAKEGHLPKLRRP